jgi:hypothetical protein
MQSISTLLAILGGKMIKVIETNLSISDTGEIKDHQSRVIEVESWDYYTNEIKEARVIIRSSIIGSLHGTSIPSQAKVENLTYDDFHLSINKFGIKSKKFAYKV